MATRFMTDPHAMRAMAGRFETHAQTVEDEARPLYASSQNISGAGWSGEDAGLNDRNLVGRRGRDGGGRGCGTCILRRQGAADGT